MKVKITNLSVRRGARTTLEATTLTVMPGEFIGLIGPNGAGKTTLMRASLGLIRAQGDSNLAALTPRKRALAAAWLPQDRHAIWAVTVETLVRLGRIPHSRPDTSPDKISSVLHHMGLTELRNRPVNQLSGGEFTRTLIARALAQDTPILMADEPVAGLDPAHQITTMEMLRLLANEGRTVITSIHDLGLAARYCTRLIMMNDAKIIADGLPASVLQADILKQVFRIKEYFYTEAQEGPIFQPLRVY